MTTLPLMDPRQSLRECAKQLVLLEDHLIHPAKRCSDCIGKHLLTAEAFAEEAATLDTVGDWSEFAGTVAERVRDLAKDATDKTKRSQMGQAARVVRKEIVEKLGVAVPTKDDDVGGFLDSIFSKELREARTARKIAAEKAKTALQEAKEAKQYARKSHKEAREARGKAEQERARVRQERAVTRQKKAEENTVNAEIDVEIAEQRLEEVKAKQAPMSGGANIGAHTQGIQFAHAVLSARRNLIGKHEIWGVGSKNGMIVVNVAPGGFGVPSTYLGYPVRTVRTAKPRLPEAVQAAQIAFAAKAGVGVVSQGAGCIQIVAVKSNLPARLFGWPVCVRPPGSLSRLMGFFGAGTFDPKPGDRVVYAWKGTNGKEDWWVGEVAKPGVKAQDGVMVESIPQDGFLAVNDTEKGSGVWWSKNGRWVVVKPSYLSDMVKESYKPTQAAMIDLIQGVVQVELPSWTVDTQRRFTLALVTAASILSRLDPLAAKGNDVGLFRLGADGVPSGTWLADKGGTEKLVVASRQDPVESTRVVIARFIVEGIDKLARDNDKASRFVQFVADRMSPWVEGGTSPLQINHWMEQGASLVTMPGVARWLGQPVPVGVSPAPTARTAPATAPVSPPTQTQPSPPSSSPAAPPPLAASLVVRPALPAPSSPLVPGTLRDWALSDDERGAFVVRWAASGAVISLVQRALGFEDTYLAAQERGNDTRAERALAAAAADWTQIGHATREAWPFVRSSVLYQDLGQPRDARRRLELAVSAPGASSDVRDMIHRELALTVPQSGVRSLLAQPSGKALAVGVGLAVGLAVVSVFSGRSA